MYSRAQSDLWRVLGEIANLLTRLNSIPPQDRATASRVYLLRCCLAVRGCLADDPERMWRMLKDVQKTMADLRALRVPTRPVIQ